MNEDRTILYSPLGIKFHVFRQLLTIEEPEFI